ncbi:MAG: thioredoxin family protein [Myxococcales bacterium]|nr:thioredoxin family protein [Myxococcales bacterium]
MCSALLLLATRPTAAIMVSTPHVDVELVADVAAAAPGDTFRLGVRFVPEKGWHVSSQNPGDTGEAPSIAWTLPPGLSAGTLERPAPERIAADTQESFGYPGEVLLAAPITVAPDLVAAAPLPLRARAQWLVCNSAGCLPGGATLTLKLGSAVARRDDAYAITAAVHSAAAPLATAPLALALAFAGGVLLNLMPCVFPVLALKALGLVGIGGEARRRVRRHGLAYLAGVVVSFWLLAGALIAARAGGAELGWGFQLQSPTVVAVLAILFFWMALVLLDVATIGGAIMGVGQHLTTGDGDRAAFFTGVLATVVATPCTAPFMGTAIGYALGQPAAAALAVFTCLGLGLAFPYVLVTWIPALARLLPRPGAWMQMLKQLLAFPLFATVAWLVWVASFQAGPPAVGAILLALVLVGFASWVGAHWPGAGGRLIAGAAAAGALALALTIPAVEAPSGAAGAAATAAAGDLVWEPYSSSRVAELRAQGRPVFVDFTAAWCVTCQMNEKVALGTAAVIAKMKELGVVALRADWTRPDATISRALQEFGRDGVPLYVLYSGRAGDPPRILPQVLTPALVIAELEKLAPA